MIASPEHELLVEVSKNLSLIRALTETPEDYEVVPIKWKDGAHPPGAAGEDERPENPAQKESPDQDEAVDEEAEDGEVDDDAEEEDDQEDADGEAGDDEEAEEQLEEKDTALSRIKTYRPDSVALFKKGGENMRVVAMELQASPNTGKERSWVYYPGRLYLDHGCTAWTLVVTVAEDVHAWCEEHIAKIPECFRHLVSLRGPADLPDTITVEEARKNPPMAFLVAAKRANLEKDKAPAQPMIAALRAAAEAARKDDSSMRAMWYTAANPAGRKTQFCASRRSRDLQRPVAACGDVI